MKELKLPKLTKEVAEQIRQEAKKEEQRIANELGVTGFDEIDRVIESLKDKEKVSISYIQRTFSYGFIKASKIFNYLVDLYIEEDGTVMKDMVILHFNESYESSLKIIFLDIDGVLNCHSTKDRVNEYIGIDDRKASLLKEIVDYTNAKIVLVSTWKEYWVKNPKHKDKQDELANYLDEKLAKAGLIIWDKISDYGTLERGHFIKEYVRIMNSVGSHISKYVILDDEMFDYKESGCTKYLVQTSFYDNGLEKKHVRKVVEMLNK